MDLVCYRSGQHSQWSQMATPARALDTISLCSTVSSCPDRNGFYGGFQRTDKPKEPLSKAQIIAREKKWLYMIDNWSIYMSKNYKKVLYYLNISIELS